MTLEPTILRRIRRSSLPVACVCALLGAREAHAQDAASRLALRGEFGGGLMLADLQRSQLGYDSAVLQATGRVAFNVQPWLSLQLSVHNGFYLTGQDGLATGRTLAFQGGVRLEPAIGRVGRLWIDANAGLLLTGDQRRPGIDAGLGFEFRAARWFGIGPFARFHYVPYDSDVNAASSAAALTFGISFTLRIPEEVAAVGLDRDGDGVLDPDDLCVDTPQGPNPDPARRGCPRPDRDGDGVFDDEDQCPTEPQGANPDPARRGCPRPDRDGDGVYDDEDQCPAEPQGANPSATRRGCPDVDTDRDGVFDSRDQCPNEHQGLRPDPARAGCPLPDRDRDTVIDPEDRCVDVPGDPANHGCPGVVTVRVGRIETPPVFFATARDVILPRSQPVLEGVANVLRSTPGIRRISIEGHTDDVDEDAANMDLSNRRAASVMRWLTEHGIDAARLEAHGFGETRPLRPIAGLSRRQRSAARAVNRRVEFNIVDPPGLSGR